VRFSSRWLGFVIGVGCLVAAAVFGILAIQNAAELSAYHHARPCPAGAPSSAACLQAVDGTVAAVTEFPGGYRISANYSLDVQIASRTLDLTFSSDSPMLGYAVDGNPAVVTLWRGVPVSVVTDGRSDVTTSVPETAFALDLGNSEKFGGVGAFFLVGVLAIRRSRKLGSSRPLMRPVLAAAVLALALGGVVVAIGGFALGGKPSRLGPDLAATGAALVVVLGLSLWLGISVRRRAGEAAARLAPAHGVAADAHDLYTPVLPPPPHARTARTPPRARMHPARWARVLRTRLVYYLPVLLTVAVLFGVFFTSQDGPAARAYRHAPACAGEANLATCAGDFTAVINGVRTPANGANGADVSYVTDDGVINTWAQFGGDTAAIAGLASADEAARTPLTIRVWHGSIVGAQLGGSWHWALDNPPGNTVPAVFLAVSFALLLLWVRLRIHRRAGRGAISQRLLADDLGQVAAAAGSVVLLAYGFWPGAILAAAVMLWLALTARQSWQRSRAALAARH
jgi:hypothetical protein